MEYLRIPYIRNGISLALHLLGPGIIFYFVERLIKGYPKRQVFTKGGAGIGE